MARKRQSPAAWSAAREMVHLAFKTATSRGGVAPFCCMLDGTHPCGVLCDTLTAAIEADRSGRTEAAALPREPGPQLPRAVCTHPGIDTDGVCYTCGEKVALGVPVEFARRLGEIHRAATAPAQSTERPPGTMCGACLGAKRMEIVGIGPSFFVDCTCQAAAPPTGEPPQGGDGT